MKKHLLLSLIAGIILSALFFSLISCLFFDSPKTPDSGNKWATVDINERVKFAVSVKGTVQNTSEDENYSSDNNEGYTVEIAIGKSLFGSSLDAVKFTASFVQDQGYDLPRINNSFIPGTSYIDPQSWIVMTNEGQK